MSGPAVLMMSRMLTVSFPPSGLGAVFDGGVRSQLVTLVTSKDTETVLGCFSNAVCAPPKISTKFSLNISLCTTPFFISRIKGCLIFEAHR